MLEVGVVHLISMAILAYFIFFILMARRRSRGPRSTRDRSVLISASVPMAVEVTWTTMALTVVGFVLIPPFLPGVVYGNWMTMPLPYSSVLQQVGLALLTVAGILATRTVNALGRYMVRSIRVVADQVLVRSGPYARIRHPMYTAVVLLVLGQTLLYLNVLLLVVLVLSVPAAVVRARTEERLLASSEAFGEEYTEYMRTTGMFLPKLRRRN